MNKNGFAPTIIIIILALAAGLGGGGYLLVSKKGFLTSKSTGAVVSTDPKLLEGLWQIETAYEWVNPPGVWKESREMLARIPYQEFKDGKMCREWPLQIFKQLTEPPTLEQALAKKYCSNYKPIRFLKKSEYKSKEKDVAAITFADEQYGTVYTWKIVKGKLEISQPGAKGIYIKIPGSRDLKEEPKDVTGPLITSFILNQQSFKIGEEVRLKCVASDERYITKFDYLVSGIGSENNSFNTGSEGSPDEPGGDSKTLTFTAKITGTYTATCKATDDSDNESERSTVNFLIVP